MTGFLDLSRCTRLGFLANWLLSLPGGIHFCKLALDCTRPEDISLTTTLVEGCSHALEYIKIDCSFHGTPIWYLLPHQQLISGSSQLGVRFN